MKLLLNILYKYGWYKQKNNKKTIIGNDGTLRLNEKQIAERLD